MDLPALNAALNGLSAGLVTVGWVAVRRHRQMLHTVCLGAATVATTAFLVGAGVLIARRPSYVVPLAGLAGYVRALLLIVHVISTLALPVLVTAAYVPVWRQHWNVHRRVGKLAMPVWLCASVSGALVYLSG